MAFQFIILAALMAVANAGFIGGYAAAPAPLAYAPAQHLAYAAPIAKAVVAKTVDADFDPHPQYSYAYDVQDSITGDFKNQHETRDGDLVQGSYSLLEADGTRRTVDYTADDHNGFNAVVRKEGVAKVATPVIAAAPAKVAYSQPISIAQPAQLSYAQPQSAHYSYEQPAQYSYAQPAQYSYAQPISAAPAQIYAQPIAKISPAAAQITYAQPIAKYAPALSYAQPIAKYEPALTYGAPIAKIPAAPAHSVLAASKYAGPLSYIAHVTYSSPYISYSH